MDIHKITGVIKDYPWGNDYFIPKLLGIPSNGPMGEYWMGAHPSGDAGIEGIVKLSRVIEEDADKYIGPYAKEKFGSKLPFLFKVLAINNPLSLQCHPNKRQAEEGWLKEEELRKKGLEYNYQDDNEKAEVIEAITPITAMCGFLALEKINENFKSFIPRSCEKFNLLKSSIKDMFLALYRLGEDQKTEVLWEYKSNLIQKKDKVKDGDFLTYKGVAMEALDEYPGDMGALAPIFMNIVHLNPGEALYLEPDTLHAYVYGNGVELMSASDNVLRGGLTHKKIDLAELSSIMSFEPSIPSKAQMEKDACGRIKAVVPSSAFSLLTCNKGFYNIDKPETAILLSIEGDVTVSQGEEKLLLKKGQACFIPYCAAPYSIDASALAFMAKIPD